MVSQVERYYPRTRRAVGPRSQTDRFYDDTRNDVRCPYAEGMEGMSEHLWRTDNPHGVTAEQVAYGEGETRNATLADADNWNGAWGFDLDLKTLDAAAWEGVDPETAVKVSEIRLRVSERDYTGDLVWLELTGTDGKVWVSQDEPSWLTRGAEVPYRFEPAAELPGGVIAARFVTTNGKGFGHAMPLRVSKVSTTETPAGCDVWIAEGGTSKRTDFAPCVVRLDYSFPATVAVALGKIESGKADAGHLHDDRYLRLTGGTLRGNVNASGSVTIKVPILNATNYFSTPMLCNEPGQYAKNHALLLGYAYHDYWEFLENGGDFRFYMHQETAGIHKQVARLTESGIYEGTTLLANKYAAKSHTHTQAQVTGLDDALAAKADTATTYSKSDVDGKLNDRPTMEVYDETGLAIRLDSSTVLSLKQSGDELSIGVGTPAGPGDVIVPTKNYVDGLVGDIQTALAAI